MTTLPVTSAVSWGALALEQDFERLAGEHRVDRSGRADVRGDLLEALDDVEVGGGMAGVDPFDDLERQYGRAGRRCRRSCSRGTWMIRHVGGRSP